MIKIKSLCLSMIILMILPIAGCNLAKMNLMGAVKSLTTHEKYLQSEPKLKVLRPGVSEETYVWLMGVGTVVTQDFGKSEVFRIGPGLLTENSQVSMREGQQVKEDVWGYKEGSQVFERYKVKLVGGKIAEVISLKSPTNQIGTRSITFSNGKLDGNTFVSSDGASLSVPNEEWLLYGSNEPNVVALFVIQETRLVSGVLYKTNTSDPTAGAGKPFTNIEEWVSNAITNSSVILPLYKVLSQENVVIHGRHTIKLTGSFHDNEIGKEMLRFRVFFEPKGQDLYALYVHVPAAELNNYKPDIESIILSVKFR